MSFQKGNKIWLGRHHTSETKRHLSKIMKKLHSNTDIWKNIKHDNFRGKRHTIETKKKMSIAQLNRFKNCKRHHFLGKKHTEETKKRMSIARKRWHKLHPDAVSKWQRGRKHSDKRVKNIIKASHKRPTSLEIKVMKFLRKQYPKQWKYVGNGALIINGHCPDFVNCNGKKQVILANGLYWHQKRYPNKSKKEIERIESKPYEEFGFMVSFIWNDNISNDLNKLRGDLYSNACG